MPLVYPNIKPVRNSIIMPYKPALNLMAINTVQNGNFSLDSNNDGLADNWHNGANDDGALTELSVLEGIQYFTGKGAPSSSAHNWFCQPYSLINLANKYYVSFKAKRLNSSGSNYIYFANGYNVALIQAISTEMNRYSFIFTPSIASPLRYDNFVFCAYDALQVGLGKALIIDLTAIFGAGNEPTQAQCDEIFFNWFDGQIAI